MSNEIKNLVTKIVDSTKAADDPVNRVITDIKIIPSTHCKYEGVFDVLCTSNDGYGWAENEDEYMFTTCVYDTSYSFLSNGVKTVADLLERKPDDFTEIQTALNKLYENEVEHSEVSESDGCRYFNTQDDGLASYAELLACGLFITSDGGCDWENIIKFKSKGFDIFAGDKDSFGWLTGCIQKGDGAILVYG